MSENIFVGLINNAAMLLSLGLTGLFFGTIPTLLAMTVWVLLCSGFHREGTTQELIEIGAKGFIRKPYNMVDLSRVVMDVIRG
ncbi:MAG: hypothetical protein WCL71_11225 [Deltaproteobacteria bacterium]